MNKELPEDLVPGWGMLERAVAAVGDNDQRTGFEHLTDAELMRRLAELDPDSPPSTWSVLPPLASLSDDELLHELHALDDSHPHRSRPQ